MARIRLKKLIFDRAAADPIATFLKNVDTSLAIQDATGAWLIGAADETAPKFPIKFGAEILGYAVGGAHAAHVAIMLSYFADRENEKVTLADEVLEKYREINLLYTISEKLGASLDLNTVAKTIFTEARRLINATAGEMILCDEIGAVQSISRFGDAPAPAESRPWDNVIARILQTGKGEIVNAGEPDAPIQSAVSFMCAPLKAKQRVNGVLVLVGDSTIMYKAGDLKLLNTVASQASPAIENALLYQKTLREAREREEHLQRQIDQLRIQIDEARLTKQVAEITETDYFQMLREKADRLRYGGEKS